MGMTSSFRSMLAPFGVRCSVWRSQPFDGCLARRLEWCSHQTTVDPSRSGGPGLSRASPRTTIQLLASFARPQPGTTDLTQGLLGGWPGNQRSHNLVTYTLELAPAAGPVVRDDLLEHGAESARVERLALTDGHRSRGLVVVSARDDPFGIGDDPAVVEEHVDMVLGRQEGADVAFQHEVWLDGALDGLHDLRVRGVDQLANLPADR